MKLAIVRQRYTPFGGAERFVARALDAFAGQGVAVDIVARSWEGKAQGVTCDPFYLGRTWRDASFAQCVRRVIDSGRYDLVQSHERIPGCHVYRAGDGVHATWLEIRGRTQTATQRLATRWQPWHRYTLRAEDGMFRHANLRAVICNSRMVRDDIAHRYPEIASRLHVVHNGFDPDTFHPGLRQEHRASLRDRAGIDAATPVILYVGSGFARKGVATLVEALAGMQTRNAQLWVVGRDRQQAHFEQLAGRLGVADRVRFWGGQTDVRPFYGAADLYCLPTLYDPFPNTVLEALACGLPAITTTSSGAAEVIVAGDEAQANGAVVAPDDAPALAASLDLWLENVRRHGGRDVSASVAHLKFAATTETMLALYRDLLGLPANL
jgi:UDP-glucose:(heptosyl)LPS alpha-1,3-glucosyltransferase